jgi:hypothetical protein
MKPKIWKSRRYAGKWCLLRKGMWIPDYHYSWREAMGAIA